MKGTNLEEFQKRLHELKKEVFKDYQRSIVNPVSRALHLAEEAGELARVERQAMEGFSFQQNKAADAIGDIMISVLAYCIARGWSAQNILELTYRHVEERWQTGQLNGVPDNTKEIYVRCEYCNSTISTLLDKKDGDSFLGECTHCQVANNTEDLVQSEPTKRIKRPLKEFIEPIE